MVDSPLLQVLIWLLLLQKRHFQVSSCIFSVERSAIGGILTGESICLSKEEAPESLGEIPENGSKLLWFCLTTTLPLDRMIYSYDGGHLGLLWCNYFCLWCCVELHLVLPLNEVLTVSVCSLDWSSRGLTYGSFPLFMSS